MTRFRNSPSPTRFASSEKSHLPEGRGIVVDVGPDAVVFSSCPVPEISVGAKVDVGTGIVVDGAEDVVFSSRPCLDMEQDDFSAFFLSLAATAISTIPAIRW